MINNGDQTKQTNPDFDSIDNYFDFEDRDSHSSSEANVNHRSPESSVQPYESTGPAQTDSQMQPIIDLQRREEILIADAQLIRLFQNINRVSLFVKIQLAILATGAVANLLMKDLHEHDPNTYNDLIDLPFDIAQASGIFAGLIPFVLVDILERFLVNYVKLGARKEHRLPTKYNLCTLPAAADPELGESKSIDLSGFSYIALRTIMLANGEKKPGFLRSTSLFLTFGCLCFIALTIILNVALLFQHNYFTLPVTLLASILLPFMLQWVLNKLNIAMDGITALQLVGAFIGMTTTVIFMPEILTVFPSSLNPKIPAVVLPTVVAGAGVANVAVVGSILDCLFWKSDKKRVVNNPILTTGQNVLGWLKSFHCKSSEEKKPLLNDDITDSIEVVRRGFNQSVND